MSAIEITKSVQSVCVYLLNFMISNLVFTSRVSSRGNKIGPICVSVCSSHAFYMLKTSSCILHGHSLQHHWECGRCTHNGVFSYHQSTFSEHDEHSIQVNWGLLGVISEYCYDWGWRALHTHSILHPYILFTNVFVRPVFHSVSCSNRWTYSSQLLLVIH